MDSWAGLANKDIAFLLMALLSIIAEITANPITFYPIIVLCSKYCKSFADILYAGKTCTTSLKLENILVIINTNAVFAASVLL